MRHSRRMLALSTRLRRVASSARGTGTLAVTALRQWSRRQVLAVRLRGQVACPAPVAATRG